MRAVKKSNRQISGKSLAGIKAPTANSVRKAGKAAGTRMGVLDDWREGGAKRTGEKTGLGKSVRDGR